MYGEAVAISPSTNIHIADFMMAIALILDITFIYEEFI
jgi:hypothetical protein